VKQRPVVEWQWGWLAINVVLGIGLWALILLALRRLVEGHW
jgi:hypothetical protein